MHYLITGGSGFIGRELCLALYIGQHQVTVLTRNAQIARRVVPASVGVVEGLDGIHDVDVVVNLAGENLASGRWTSARKDALVRSRIEMTRALLTWLARQAVKPAALISGSAIGWYGHSDDRKLGENEAAGSDFAAMLCRQWEDEAEKAAELGVRVCRLRTGVVLSRAGGALARMLPLFQLGLGGPIGDGTQWMSWIHRSDLVALILWLASHPSARGAYNGTAPTPVRNAEFATLLGAAMRRPALLRTPAFVLRAALGEMADIVTTGQRVLPERALADGFTFRFPDLPSALAAEFDSKV